MASVKTRSLVPCLWVETITARSGASYHENPCEKGGFVEGAVTLTGEDQMTAVRGSGLVEGRQLARARSVYRIAETIERRILELTVEQPA